MRRSATILIWLAVAIGGCANVSPVVTTPLVSADAASSESHAAASVSAATSRSDSPPAEAAWAGPVRPPSANEGPVDPEGSGRLSSALDEHDADREYVDIEQVLVDFPDQPHWRLSLNGAPPEAATLDATRTVISYGLAFETTGDDAPDYLVGISNEAPTAGDYRVWVTDLATGATDEQVGGPYGFPIEFRHPDEPVPEPGVPPTMVFTFLGDSRPAGVTLNTRFYAWASVEEDGAVVAWDYAPDIGWVGAAPGAAPAEGPATPAPVANPPAPADFPECQAQEFDFIGEGTLRGLGLHTATPVTPPDIDRVGMIWVTRDLMPHDFGVPGGEVEMTRMLCFEFPDGTGGSGWPVDPAWRPPTTDDPVASGDTDDERPSPALLALVLLALLALVVSALAFRSHR